MARRNSVTAALGGGTGEAKWWEKALEEAEEDKTPWRALVTEDGLDYYMNIDTDETTWDKPVELMTSDELDSQGEWRWVPHETEVYVPAKVESTQGKKVRVGHADGSVEVVKKNLTIPMQRSYLARVVSDLTLLDDLAAPLILHNLNKRFQSGDIYTNIGNILISINPYQRLPLYTDEVVRKYSKRKMGAQVPPHVYDIAHDSYYRLTAFSRLQSIIISGESGAGKTECTKQALQYLAAVAGSTSNVEGKILSANPVLEAFGNAKTLRNDNSSRFGKYMEIFFDHNGKISGCATQNYLLEKIRVVQPGSGERNFHIFYQLCKASDSNLRERLKLTTKCEDYTYLKTCVDVPGIDDEREFKDVEEAFASLDFEEEEKNGMYDMVAAILALGNVTFAETKPDECEAQQSGGTWLNDAADLLRLDRQALASALVHREVRIRGQEKTFANLDVHAASDSRHALCKFVYGRMFDWLVERINISMVKSTGKAVNTNGHANGGQHYIGILDIFGFEIFKSNSFEQLCINFTNEMLQQHFNNNTFKLEEEIYVKEGIQWDAIDFIDNQPMIDLITGKRIGILPLLDEELKLPGGSDSKYLSRLLDKQMKNVAMKKTKSRNAFRVQHFAGIVEYDVLGFLEKNRDTLTEDLVDMLRSSDHSFLTTMYPSDAVTSTSSRKASLAKQFQKQLKDLMAQLYATEPHYIRCIKPNDSKAALKFIPRNCYEQLTYSGVFEAVAIRKKGFPFRLTHQDFVDRYEKCLKKEDVSKGGSDLKSRSKNIAKCMKLDMKNFQVGRTLVLYRAREYRSLELTWSVVTKHETIKERVKELIQMKTDGQSKEERDDYCMDLAYAVREASLFRITGSDIEKAKKLLDKFIEERMDPETKKLLNEAIRTKNGTKLQSVLDRCEKKGIEGSLVSECRRLQGLVEDAEGALAYATSSMVEKHLERALAMCDEFEYTSETEVACRKLLKNVTKATKGIRQALKKGPRYKATMVDKVVKFCNGFGYDTKDFQKLMTLSKKLRGARKQLNRAYDVVDEKKLVKAIEMCSEKSFNGTRYECTLIDDCQTLLDRIRLVNKEAKKAKKQMIGEQVEVVVDAARRIKLKSDTIVYLSDILNGSQKKFLQKQIDGAVAEKDLARASRVQMELHTLNVEKNKGPKPDTFKNLQTPMQWSQGSAKKAAMMHEWQSRSISEPLTNKCVNILTTGQRRR